LAVTMRARLWSSSAPPPLQQVLDLLASVSELEAALDQLHALADAVELAGQELLRLHEHLLAHADLAEIVQEGGVAELGHLLGAETRGAIGPGLRTVDRRGETHREVGDAGRMA